MLKHRYTRVAILTAVILIACWMVLPKSFHAVFSPSVNTEIQISQDQLETDPSDENFEKIEKPVYFSIFKFITGFIPSRQKHTVR